MSPFLIYGFVDTRPGKNGQIRYVGRSASGMARPMAHFSPYHVRTDHTHCRNLIKSHIDMNLKPEIVILEECDKRSELEGAEIYWIGLFKLAGADLVNHTKGGEGSFGLHPSDATRQKIREKHIGKTLSAETRAKISLGGKGLKRSDVTRQRISAAKKNRILSPETRAKISAAKRGSTQNLTVEARRILSERMTQRNLVRWAKK